MRIPLKDRPLPKYSRRQEIANSITHIIGGAIGVAVLIWGVLVSALLGNAWDVVGCSIYGVSMIALYTLSSVYHGLREGYAKRVLQVLDHCTIYLLIAGTYTPILFSAIREISPLSAWVIFGVEWGLAAAAAAFTAIDHQKYRILSMACYIGLGWCVVFILPITFRAVGNGFWWLLAGGIAYTVGAVLYGAGKKQPWLHTVFHIFVLIGSLLQAICVLFYVL